MLAGAPAASPLFGGGEGFDTGGEFSGGSAGGGEFAGAGADCAGAFPDGGGAACMGAVGGAAGVTLCTATRTFSTSESTSSSENCGCPR